MIRTTFSVNVLPQLNLTAHYQRLTALRILNVSQSEQRETDHHSAWVSGNYTSKKGNYRIWGNYQHLNHLEYETGGGLANTPNQSDSLFISPDLMPVALSSNARNRELRNNWYFSQIWKPFENGLYLRTSHRRTRQVNRFTDPAPNLNFYGADRLYFQKSNSDGKTDTLFSDRCFQAWENTGYAGYQDSLQDLSFYLKRRDLRYYSNLQTFLSGRSEWIAGFLFQGLYKGLKARLLAEWLNANEFDLDGKIVLRGWNLGGRLFSFQPSMIQREFISKNLYYLTDFKPSRAVRITFDKRFQLGKWTIGPSFEHISIANGIAFDGTFLPVQRDKIATMQYAGISIEGSLGGRIHTDNRFIRVFQAGSRISQMPAYIYRSAHWFDLVKNRKSYGVQLGFNLDWRFDWPTENFNPLTGQWFLQNQTTIPPYFLLDAFAHIRIDRVRLYFKVHNSLQKVGSPGYFAAPNYPGQRRLFEFGLNWTFFD
jgi:hypothetical protein